MEARYTERRTVPLKTVLELVIVFALIAIYKSVTGDVGAGTVLAGAGALAVGLVIFIGIGASPIGPFFKHVRVGEDGLQVGSKLLPASHIGRIWKLEVGQARSAVPRGRFEGLKVTRSSFGWFVTQDGAVIVEDTSAAQPSAWMVATRDPDALRTALGSVSPHTRAR